MQKKLIITDLDGTALESSSKLGFITRYYLIKAQQQGHSVAIATGRSKDFSLRFHKELHLNNYLINLNGNLISNPSSQYEKSVFTSIDKDPIISLLQSPLNETIRTVVFELEDETVVDRIDPYLFNIWKIESGTNFTPQVYPRSQIFKRDIAMVSIFVDNENENEVMEFLKPAFSETFSARAWFHEVAKLSVIEVFNKSISKVEGISFIAKKLEIPKNEIICFGDQINDLEMIQYCGMGIAMENAISVLKEHADDITKYDNKFSGVGYHLKELLDLK